MIRDRTFLALAVVAMASLFMATSANAEIIVDGFDNWNSGGSPIVGNFDASGSDKLVVIVTGEHGFNQTGNGQGGDVTYDGVLMTRIIDRNPIKADAGPPVVLVDDTFQDMWYLDNPATSTGLISATATTRGNVTVVGLSGTLAGAGNTVIGARDSSSADLVTSAGSIVIASYGMGGDGNTAVLSQVTTNLDTEMSRQENGSNWDGHVTGYTNGVAAGSATYSFTDTGTPGADGRTGSHVIAAEFLVVPEPGSLALLVVGSLMGLIGFGRRRKR